MLWVRRWSAFYFKQWTKILVSRHAISIRAVAKFDIAEMPSEARLGSNGGELHERIVFQSAVGKSDAVKREVAIWEAQFFVAAVDGFGGNVVESDVAIRRRVVVGVADAEGGVLHMQAVKAIQHRSASQIFGYPDDMKFRSAITLFASFAGEESVSHDLITKYCAGQPDERTLEILKAQDVNERLQS